MQWFRNAIPWLFSGAGLVLVTELFRYGRRRWRESRNNLPDAQKVSHAQIAGGPLRSRLPGFALRLRYKPDDIRQRVVIGLRDNAPGSVNLAQDVPHVDLYFQITNLSPIDLVLDRALVDVWFSQPTFTAFLLHRYSVPAGEITQGIHVRQTLTESQKAYIKAFEDAPRGTRGQFHIYITAYFESKLGRFSVESAINRDRL